jgi:hypothetical protein
VRPRDIANVSIVAGRRGAGIHLSGGNGLVPRRCGRVKRTGIVHLVDGGLGSISWEARRLQSDTYTENVGRIEDDEIPLDGAFMFFVELPCRCDSG